MNTQQLLGWMHDPASAGKEAGAQLESLTQAFPYFQTAQLLLIKSLHNQNSFLYNNQLKVTAAYATNRKVLYELITKKAEPVKVSTPEVQGPEPVIEKKEPETAKAEEETIIQPEFPKKRFVSNPDDWEAGMLRQLQLLHHWKTNPAEELEKLQKQQAEKNIPAKTEEPPLPVVAEKSEPAPTAADEINTLLYVLVEPDDAEDISAEEENSVSEEQQWEVQPLAEVRTEEEMQAETAEENPVPVPEDPVQQEIIREAISSTIELEVDDVLPKPEDLLPPSLRPETEIVKIPEVQPETEPAEESSEMSFGAWLKKLDKSAKPVFTEEVRATAEEPVLPSEHKSNDLIDKFIKEQPRINPQKTTFYNPANMAKKSVQESDEFITETLARIYVKQGNISKAIRAYQKLSLKFPEKTAYFAALIEELKRTPK